MKLQWIDPFPGRSDDYDLRDMSATYQGRLRGWVTPPPKSGRTNTFYAYAREGMNTFGTVHAEFDNLDDAKAWVVAMVALGEKP